jgi:hypothetical protein
LRSPFGRGKRFTKVLRLVPYFSAPKFHHADSVVRLTFVLDNVLRDPEFTTAGYPTNAKAGRFTRMMGAESLQIVAAMNAFTGLRIVTDSVLFVDRVFRFLIAGTRCSPVRVQRLENFNLAFRRFHRFNFAYK